MGIGLRALGFNVAKAYDTWDEAVAVYNHNVALPTAVSCNLMTAKGRQTVESDAAKLGEVEILAAGPPCKGFSQLRNGRHDGRNGITGCWR
jgi:site-specific DNA-cytosine methylase